MHRTSAMNVPMSRVRSPSSVPVDPLQPVLGTMTSDQVLEIVCGRNTLRLSGAKEVFFDRVGVIAERDLDRALEAVDVAIVAGPLICFMLLHERDELLGGPALGLEVIVVGSGSAGVHLHVISIKLALFESSLP
jgi:hypothetical protein